MKNPNGYGTVYKLSGHRRKPWCAAGPAKRDGSRMKRDVIGYFESRKEAMLALSQWHIAPPAAKAEMTLQELRDEWKAVKYQPLDKSTKDGYNAAWKNLAPLYDRRVADIRTGEFQAIIDGLNASYSKLHQIKVLCTQLESYAMQNDIINKNYASFIVLPKNDTPKKEAFTDLEVKKIEKGAANGIPYADLILILCYTGWRITEFLELTPFSYDPVERTLRGGLKTDAGRNRIVPIHPKIQPYVDRWLAKGGSTIFCREKAIGKQGNKHTELIPYTSNYFREYCYYPALEQLGVRKLTPHATRHTFISMEHRAGADKLTVKRIVGHASGDVTDKVYTHVEIEELRKAVELLA